VTHFAGNTVYEFEQVMAKCSKPGRALPAPFASCALWKVFAPLNIAWQLYQIDPARRPGSKHALQAASTAAGIRCDFARYGPATCPDRVNISIVALIPNVNVFVSSGFHWFRSGR